MNIAALKAIIIGSILSICSLANAGLIHNNLNWLDLSVTTGLSRTEVENNILTQNRYSSYRYATISEVNSLYLDYVLEQNGEQITASQWHIAENPESDILNYFYTMTSGSQWNNSLRTVDGELGFDNWDFNSGRLIFGADLNNVETNTSYAWLEVMRSTNLPVLSAQIFLRSASDNKSPQALSLYKQGDTYKNAFNNSILVREVSEPSIIIVILAGLLALTVQRRRMQASAI